MVSTRRKQYEGYSSDDGSVTELPQRRTRRSSSSSQPDRPSSSLSGNTPSSLPRRAKSMRIAVQAMESIEENPEVAATASSLPTASKKGSKVVDVIDICDESDSSNLESAEKFEKIAEGEDIMEVTEINESSSSPPSTDDCCIVLTRLKDTKVPEVPEEFECRSSDKSSVETKKLEEEDISEPFTEAEEAIPKRDSNKKERTSDLTPLESREASTEGCETVSHTDCDIIGNDTVVNAAKDSKITTLNSVGESKLKKKKKKLEKPGRDGNVVIRGRNISNRFWKEPAGRASSIIKGAHVHRGWDKQKRLREELNRTKELTRRLIQQQKEAKEAARLRAEERKKQKEENSRKAEVVQVITNTTKLKRMKKKQLRYIQKRDTTDAIQKRREM